jgi:hypothetical protein
MWLMAASGIIVAVVAVMLAYKGVRMRSRRQTSSQRR